MKKFQIRSKINHDSMWMKFIDGKREIRLGVSRSGERITYVREDREIATEIWNDFKAEIVSKNFKDAFDSLKAKYEAA